jgi:hypothetical protein
MWRRAATNLLPEYNRGLTIYDDPETSLYHVLFEVNRDLDKRILADDKAWLARVFGFAEICFEQRLTDPDSWNAVGAVLLEHLADHDNRLGVIVDYVSPEIFLVMKSEFKKRRDRKVKNGFSDLLEKYNAKRGTRFAE